MVRLCHSYYVPCMTLSWHADSTKPLFIQSYHSYFGVMLCSFDACLVHIQYVILTSLWDLYSVRNAPKTSNLQLSIACRHAAESWYHD